MKRLFIGVPVASEKAARDVEVWKLKPEFSGNVLKWTKPENWHITLIFLGSTDESMISTLQGLIQESFINIDAFSTRIKGLGVFPNLHNPRVLWLGIENIQSLMPGYQRLAELMRQNGFSLDNKPLKPHISLARVKGSTRDHSILSMINKHHDTDFGQVAINSVALFESISTNDGPVYKPLFVFKLQEK